jgi:predicted heme/steroid binding protein
VTGYGLASEHTLGNLVEWNGENGRSYFFQSELPYDVDTDYADNGYAGYKVGDDVQNHEAWGIGVYSFFRDHEVLTTSGIVAPANDGIKYHNSMSLFLAGNGGIQHVINDQGDSVMGGGQGAYVCEWPSDDTEEAFMQ